MDGKDIRKLEHDGLHQPSSIEERHVIDSGKELAFELSKRFSPYFDDARDIHSELQEPLTEEEFEQKAQEVTEVIPFEHNGIGFNIFLTSLVVEKDATEGDRLHDGLVRTVEGVISITIRTEKEEDAHNEPYAFPFMQIHGSDGAWTSFEVLAEMPVSIPVEQNANPNHIHREFMRLSAITEDPLQDPELGEHALFGLNEVLRSALDAVKVLPQSRKSAP